MEDIEKVKLFMEQQEKLKKEKILGGLVETREYIDDLLAKNEEQQKEIIKLRQKIKEKELDIKLFRDIWGKK